MKITLHRNQGTVFHSTSRFKVLAAGRRFGKTILACVLLFVNCLKVKNGLFWYVSPTYKQTKQIAWKILLRMIPQEVLAKKPNETDLSFTFRNGTELVLKGADNPDGLRGTGLDGLVNDEFASVRNSKSVWEEVLRPSLSDKLGWCFFIGTPKGKDAFWELWVKGQRKEDGFESWSFKTEDNPFIQRSEIKAAKDSLNERYFRQEYEASFEDYTGMIWPEYEASKHVIDPFDVPQHWNSFGVIDTAITGTTAALKFVVDEHGNLFITQEYYERDKRVNEVADVLRGWGVSEWFIDPAAKLQKTANMGRVFSLYDEYLEHGIIATPAENDVDAGINRVAEYLKAERVKIFRNCKNLQFELERYHWAEEREGVLGISRPQPYKSLDHLCDCKRYGIMSRPSASRSIPIPKAGSKLMTADNIELMEQQQYAFEED